MKNIYQSIQVKNIDKLAAQYLQIDSFELMQKAGTAIYSYVRQYNNIMVVAGAGNNAGDGFIIAQQALEQGLKAIVWSLISIENLPEDAQKAANYYLQSGGKIVLKQPSEQYDCVVDALFGTGLCRDITGQFAEAVKWINLQNSTVIAVDIPSGLDADTGEIKACVVDADITVTVICYKAGLLTNNGKDRCGNLFCETLKIPTNAYAQINTQMKLLNRKVLKHRVLKHQHNSHKGLFGSVVIVGGHDGMLGALILAGKAALRSGCGLVEVVSNSQQAVMISIQCPELLTANSIQASRLIEKADVIAVGPGLGLNQQSIDVLNHCIKQNKPMVIDADALTLIAGKFKFNNPTVLTPHPKEAATLLSTDVATVQSDRVAAAIKISQMYQVSVILKGSGTVIADIEGNVFICPFGYSGMATAGMGDVLTGMVASLMAQGCLPIDAANIAVVWHALAAENCHKGNGLIASDVIQQLVYEAL